MAGRMPVSGPNRLYVDPTPSGVGLDVSHFLHSVLVSLAEQAAEDPQGVVDDLVEIAELAGSAASQGPDSHAVHERDARVQELLEQVAGDGVIPVDGAQVGALAERLRRLAQPRPVPGQREGGAAA